MDNSVTIVLPIHNQEDIIENVLYGINNNISDNVKEMIIILDGCTDGSEYKVDKFLPNVKSGVDLKIVYAPDVFEVISNNIGFKMSTCQYSLTIQDDMVITEKDFDKRMMKPFEVVSNLLGVTARNAQDETIINNKIEYFNVAGKDVNSPRNIFSIRDVIVRGPILFNNDKLKELNYLDVDFAPLDSDDKDLCFRAYKQFGYVVGSYVIDYVSKLEWGGTRRNSNSYRIWESSALKNLELLKQRHSDILLSNKHDEDVVIVG